MTVEGSGGSEFDEIHSQIYPVAACEGEETPKEMWDAWKALHIMNNQRINVHYHFEDLYTWKYIDSTNMTDHIASMLDL